MDGWIPLVLTHVCVSVSDEGRTENKQGEKVAFLY